MLSLPLFAAPRISKLSPDALLFCRKCGCYSTSRLVGLAGPRSGRPLIGPARTRLRRMGRGMHPVFPWTSTVFPIRSFWVQEAGLVQPRGILWPRSAECTSPVRWTR